MYGELKFFLQVSEDDLDVSVKKTNIDFHTPGGSIDQILDLVVVLRFSLLLLSPGSLIAKLSNMWLIGENLFAIMKLSIRFFLPRDAYWNEQPLLEMRIWIVLVGLMMLLALCDSGGLK